MKKHNHPIDEFFRESLKDYKMEPSDGAKGAFLKDALQLPPPLIKGRKGLTLLLALISLIGAGIILWTLAEDPFTSISDQASNSPAVKRLAAGQKTSLSKTANTDHQNPSQPQFQQQEPQPEQQKQYFQQQPKLQQPEQSRQSQQLKQQQPQQQQQPQPQPQKPQSQKPQSQQIIQENPAAAVPVTPAPAFVTTQAANVSPSIRPNASVSNEVYRNSAEGTILTNLTKDNLTNQATGNLTNLATSNPANLATSNPANLVTSNPANQGKTDRANQAPDSVLAVKKGDSSFKPVTRIRGKSMHDRGNQQNWIPDIGIYYTPEWMFNTLEGTKFVNNFGIEGTFHIGRFSIRTGAGLSAGKGTNELVVEYNDFLGTYNKLDSMSFTWNDPTHNYIPTMYLSKKDVWDSLMKLDYARIVKRYTYLQVPMIMGYDFWESDRIVLGVRLGPVMSILLASKQLSEDYEPGKKQIISINAIAPEQVSLNWQVLGGLNAAYRLTDVLNIEIEPSVRYYFNSVYEKPVNNAKPWSAGVRVAFVVKF